MCVLDSAIARATSRGIDAPPLGGGGDQHGARLSARGAERLRLTSARELGEGELKALIAQLEHRYGKKFEVTRVVDPSVIGGVRILMGDRRIDATIAGRLDALARELSTSN